MRTARRRQTPTSTGARGSRERRPSARRRTGESSTGVPPAYWGLATVVGLAVAGLAVYGLTRPVEGGRPAAVCGLLIDRTVSHLSSETAGSLEADARAVVDGCARRDAWLMAYGVDAGARRITDLGAYPLFAAEGRTATYREAGRDDARTTAHAALDTYIAADPPPGEAGSDILAAMEVAAENLQLQARDEDIADVFLVVLTDALQMSADLSVEEISRPDVDLRPLLRRAEAAGIVPELSGVDVAMVGPNGGEAGGGVRLPAWFQARVEEFWRSVVTAGGGTLCHYSAEAPSRLPIDC